MKHYRRVIHIFLVAVAAYVCVTVFYSLLLPEPSGSGGTAQKAQPRRERSDRALARSEAGSPSVYKPDKAYRGYTLFCSTHGDWPRTEEAHVYLVNMKGEIYHKWKVKTTVQLPRLMPDGTLLYSTRDRSNIKQAGLRRLAPDSEVLWRYHCRIDHDFRVLDNGNLLIHCLQDEMVPSLGAQLKRNPSIIEITPSKKLVWEWHGENHIQELVESMGLNWDRMKKKYKGKAARFDWAHNNTVAVIPENASGEKDERFKEGNLLFSYRKLSVVGVIDRDTGKIVWAWGPGHIEGQHDVQMLSNGHLLMFDNGCDKTPPERGWSRAVEVDPLSEKIVWSYHGDPRKSFYSRGISGVQKLPNGNIFICSGAERRLFEVTPDKEIVWQYTPPFEIKGTYGIYQATRYSPEYVHEALGEKAVSQ